jgi:hypothetical protein
MYQYMQEDTNARYIAILREADEARVARSLRRPRAPIRWFHWPRLRGAISR